MTRVRDRIAAARLLLPKLMPYRGRHPLILGIPRGAMPMAGEIARALDGDLDVVLAHKLPAPGNPEFALGAVSERGQLCLNPELAMLRLPPGYLRSEILRQIALLRDRRARYARFHESADPGGRTVIVVDDGAATGATTTAALREVRLRNPAELIVAMAVAPVEVVHQLAGEADRVVVLLQPFEMTSVGEFFEEFPQVSDEEVIGTLEEFRSRESSSTPGRRESCASRRS